MTIDSAGGFGDLVADALGSDLALELCEGEQHVERQALLSYLTVSVIYYALALPFADLVLSVQEPVYPKALAWFGLVFAGPALFGRSLAYRVGINRNYVGMIERRENSPTVAMVERLAEALQVDPVVLLQRDKP